MLFLSPQSDIAFKKLFGDMAHKKIAISFLNSVLGRTGQEEIIDAVMNDPNNFPETMESKTSVVDIRCTDQQGNQYIVEMQVISQLDYAARAQYYSAIALSRQLGKGEKYYKLMPVIFVGVLSFNLFGSIESYISHHLILDKKTHVHELKHLEFHFIELPKFNKEEKELIDMVDKWIYFLKNASKLENIPPLLKEPILEEAFGVLAHSNWSQKELDVYDRYMDSIRSSESQNETARLEEKLAIAQDLLDVLDVATIAKKTRLTVEQVEKLKNRVK